MQSALDRRQAMLELLSDRRQETVANLMSEFGVSRCTVLRDIETLSCSAPIFTVQGNGGGVRVADGYYYGRRYLHSDQEALLRKLMPGLQPDEQKTIQSMHFFKSILLRIICPVGLSETTVASSSITSKGHTKLSSRQKSGKSFS